MIPWFFWLLLLLVILSFPFVANILAHKSGWKNLAERYGFGEKPKIAKGVPLRVWSAVIGGFSYQNVLRFKSAQKGLLIWQIWPFSISHKAVLIPWNAIVKVEEQQQSLGPVVRLTIGDPMIATIDFRKKEYEKIRKELRLKTIKK